MDWQGKKLGNYQVERLLGSGAFADVYLGKHIYLNTSAAIKILQTHLDENGLQGFLSEARTVANLTHANIIRVLEFDAKEQTPYLVMDYAPAGTLRQRHPRSSRLTMDECVAYMQQVASALQYAHDHRVIHRDVKPENMLIGPNGQLLLSDFGIALAAQSSRYQGQQEFGGTAAYAAPEQIQGLATYASDQYALGIILYEWLTGELPFRGSFFEVCSQHLFKPAPSLLEKVPGLPPGVEQVYQKAVAKEVQQRFTRVEDFAQALDIANQGNDPTVLIGNNVPASDASTIPYSSPAPANIGKVPVASQPASSPPYVSSTNRASSSPYQPGISPVSLATRKQIRNPTATTLIIVLLVLLVATGIWGYSHQASGSTAQGQNSNSSQLTSTTSDTSGSTDSTGSTATDTPTPPPQPSVIASDGTVQVNKTLTCGNCDDPVHVKVDTVVIQNGNGRMLWSLTLTDVSGNSICIDGPTLSLHDPISAQNLAPASVNESSDDSGSCFPLDTLASGSSYDFIATFTFLPYTQANYTLNVEVSGNASNSFDIKFDPLDVTFS